MLQYEAHPLINVYTTQIENQCKSSNIVVKNFLLFVLLIALCALAALNLLLYVMSVLYSDELFVCILRISDPTMSTDEELNVAITIGQLIYCRMPCDYLDIVRIIVCRVYSFLTAKLTQARFRRLRKMPVIKKPRLCVLILVTFEIIYLTVLSQCTLPKDVYAIQA